VIVWLADAGSIAPKEKLVLNRELVAELDFGTYGLRWVAIANDNTPERPDK
jgi:hypothetical protein